MRSLASTNEHVSSSGRKHILDRAGETLVLLGIVVLESDLEFHGLQEAALLRLGALQDGIHRLVQSITGHLRPEEELKDIVVRVRDVV